MDQQKAKKNKFEWTYIETIFCIISVLIIFIPLLLTRSSGLPSFRDTGPIGDTIGGTTAPFIGLLGAWLVYKALKAQIKANELIINQFNEQKLLSVVTEQLNVLRDDIKEFDLPDNGNFPGAPSKGIEAIKLVLANYRRNCPETSAIISAYNSKLVEIKYFLESIDYLINMVLASPVEDKDKGYLIATIRQVHTVKLLQHINKYQTRRNSIIKTCKICNMQHGIPESIFELNDRILQKLPTQMNDQK